MTVIKGDMHRKAWFTASGVQLSGECLWKSRTLGTLAPKINKVPMGPKMHWWVKLLCHSWSRMMNDVWGMMDDEDDDDDGGTHLWYFSIPYLYTMSILSVHDSPFGKGTKPPPGVGFGAATAVMAAEIRSEHHDLQCSHQCLWDAWQSVTTCSMQWQSCFVHRGCTGSWLGSM